MLADPQRALRCYAGRDQNTPEGAGYVKRERNPDDRRVYVITLTAAGKRAQARAEETVDAHALQFFGQLSEAERQELHRLLARLIEGPE